MAELKLTVRQGARVEREEFADLREAVRAMRRRAEEIRAEGGLEQVSMLRTFEPGDRVAARIEISTGGWLRGADAGVDVMGDGSVVAFSGGITRTPLEPAHNEDVYDAVRRAIEKRTR